MTVDDSRITHKTLDLESMSPENEDKESPKSEAASSKSEDNAASEAAQKQAAKRRTKTGCLSKSSITPSTYSHLLTSLNHYSLSKEANQVRRGEAGKYNSRREQRLSCSQCRRYARIV